MDLSVKGLAITAGLLWGAYVFLVGLIEIAVPGYGKDFLEFAASLYPGYEYSSTVTSVLIGTGYGLIDGAVGGAVFAWIYNKVTE